MRQFMKWLTIMSLVLTSVVAIQAQPPAPDGRGDTSGGDGVTAQGGFFVQGVVNTGALNVRSVPSATNNTPITQIYRDTTVTLIGRNFDSQWYQIQLDNGTIGWVRGTYITVTFGSIFELPITDGNVAPPPPTPTPVPPPPQTVHGFVNTFALNLRAVPTAYNNTPILTLFQNTPLTLIGRNAATTWYQVRLANGTIGWLSAPYVAVTQGNVYALPITDGNIVQPPPPPVGVVTGFVNTGALNVRNVPSPYWNIPIRVVFRNTHLTLIGRNGNATWYQARLSDGTVGWVRSTYITVTQGNVHGLPITG